MGTGTRHPDFPLVQRRLRRLDPAFYPSSVLIDDEWGPRMSRGINALLDQAEGAKGLGPIDLPPSAIALGDGETAAGAPVGMPRGLDKKFGFLFQTPLPPLMVRLALAEFGTLERAGTADHPRILGWADEVARASPTPYNRWAADFYNDDSVPWCGLFMAVMAVRAAQGRPERMPPKNYLAALSWLQWGVEVPINEAAVGDIMVLGRKGGGHVCENVGTEKGGDRFFGLGGNQSDAVNVLPFPLERVRGVRRPPYRDLPAGARRVILAAGGASSTREA